jgi:hypothetical protein
VPLSASLGSTRMVDANQGRVGFGFLCASKKISNEGFSKSKGSFRSPRFPISV